MKNIKTIETSMTVIVSPDPDYHYEIFCGPFGFFLAYHELDKKVKNAHISFGSIEEMESVALSMLRAVRSSKNQGEVN